VEKPKYRTATAEKWFGKANQFEPKAGTNYQWVWEYAKFRLAWATERVQHMEGKALEFLKVILALGAAAWAVLTAFHVSLTGLPLWSLWLGRMSFLVFVLSIGLGLWAYLPTKRLIPVSEDKALLCADEYEDDSKAMAKFAQTLSSATEHEIDTAAHKAKLLWLAALSLASALTLFLIAAFLKGYR